MISGRFVDETRSVKCFAEVIYYARFRWLGGKETGTPETVHQRKHRQLRYTIQTDGGPRTNNFGALPRTQLLIIILKNILLNYTGYKKYVTFT